MTKTNEQKNQVIASKVGICYKHKIIGEGKWLKCETCGSYKNLFDNPNFFTPEGQKVLAGALLERDNREVWDDFNRWVTKEKSLLIKDNLPTAYTTRAWLTIIADTKLAELFYEFIESEGK